MSVKPYLRNETHAERRTQRSTAQYSTAQCRTRGCRRVRELLQIFCKTNIVRRWSHSHVFYQMNKMNIMAGTYSTLSISCTILSVVASKAERTSGRNRPPSPSVPDDWRCSWRDVLEEEEEEEEEGLFVEVPPCGSGETWKDKKALDKEWHESITMSCTVLCRLMLYYVIWRNCCCLSSIATAYSILYRTLFKLFTRRHYTADPISDVIIRVGWSIAQLEK